MDFWSSFNRSPPDPNQYSNPAAAFLKTMPVKPEADVILEQTRGVRRARRVFNHKNLEALISNEFIDENQSIIEVNGYISLAKETIRKPGETDGIFLYHGLEGPIGQHQMICIDTKFGGNEAIFIRRSCDNNSSLKHILGSRFNLRIMICAVKAIRENDEITLPFDRDYMYSCVPLKCAAHQNNMDNCPSEIHRRIQFQMNKEKEEKMKLTRKEEDLRKELGRIKERRTREADATSTVVNKETTNSASVVPSMTTSKPEKPSAKFQLDPEDCRFIRFLQKRCSTASAPIFRYHICEEFVDIYKSSKSSIFWLERFQNVFAHQIPSIANFDLETKIKMMFVSGIPITDVFMTVLKQHGIVQLDEKRRIIVYKATNGMLELEGSHADEGKKNAYDKYQEQKIDKYQEQQTIEASVQLVRLDHNYHKIAQEQACSLNENENSKKDAETGNQAIKASHPSVQDEEISSSNDNNKKTEEKEEGEISDSDANTQDEEEESKAEKGETDKEDLSFSVRDSNTSFPQEATTPEKEPKINKFQSCAKNDSKVFEYLAERVKLIEQPLVLSTFWKEYKQDTNSTLSVDHIRRRFREILAPKIHQLDDYDTETKVRMIFATSTSIEKGFLKKIQKLGEVSVDGLNRITKYVSIGGSLNLRGCHLTPIKRNSSVSKNNNKRSSLDEPEMATQPPKNRRISIRLAEKIAKDRIESSNIQHENSTPYAPEAPPKPIHDQEPLSDNPLIHQDYNIYMQPSARNEAPIVSNDEAELAIRVQTNQNVSTQEIIDSYQETASFNISCGPETTPETMQIQKQEAPIHKPQVQQNTYKFVKTSDKKARLDSHAIKPKLEIPPEIPVKIEPIDDGFNCNSRSPSIATSSIRSSPAPSPQTTKTLKDFLRTLRCLIFSLDFPKLSKIREQVKQTLDNLGDRNQQIPVSTIQWSLQTAVSMVTKQFILPSTSELRSTTSPESKTSLKEFLNLLKIMILGLECSQLNGLLDQVNSSIQNLKVIDQQIPIDKIRLVIEMILATVSH